MAKYGGFGGGGNMQALMRQAQKMQEDMLKAQEELKDTEFTAEAGGGLVEVTLSGDKMMSAIKIKPEAVDMDDLEMLEDLIIAAYNEAAAAVDEEAEKVMGPYAGMLGGLRSWIKFHLLKILYKSSLNCPVLVKKLLLGTPTQFWA